MPIPAEVPITRYFSQERVEHVHGYARDRIQSLVRGLRTLRSDKISQWRKIYYGTPREKVKSFPWQNASNVVIQLVGSFVDQLTAKIVMGCVAMDPTLVAQLLGEFPAEQQAESQRQAIEEWLAYRLMEPGQINYLPKADIWIRTLIRYGFGCMKLMPKRTIEQVVEADGGFREYERHNGPVALPLMFEDWLMPSTTVELENSPFNAQRARLERFELEAMKHDPSYNRAVLSEVLKSPTRQGPDRNQQQIENDTGATADPGNAVVDQWDVYECYFPYQMGGKTFRLISTCVCDEDGQNPRFIKDVFNWLPDNALPYIGARLGSDGERPYGFGFCEMLKDYQEETSAIHNRRGDASTLANTNLIRIDTGQQIDSNFSIFPNATISGAKDSIEVIPLGRTANETIKDEQMTLQLATDRAGIGPSSSGSGAGTVNKKGAYSAMGTSAVMQEGNTRANLNITEFRQAHYCFGRLALLYDSRFGISERDLQAIGKQGRHLQKALENVRDNRIILPIRAATGSVNKEIEKQNLMLLLNNWRAHVQQNSQIMQQLTNPMMAQFPEWADYLMNIVLTGNVLMAKICRDFGVADPTAILPEPLGIQDKVDDIQQQHRQRQLMEALKRSLPQMRQALGAGLGNGNAPAGQEPPGSQQPGAAPPAAITPGTEVTQ